MNREPHPLERALALNRPALVRHHLGLGDHLICNGLIRHIVASYPHRTLWLVTKRGNIANVQRMFGDLPQVRCLAIDPRTPEEEALEISALPLDWSKVNHLRIGFEHTRYPHWDRSFYEQVGVPFGYSWSKFHVDRDAASEALLEAEVLPDGPFALVHDVGSAGRYPIRLETGLAVVHVKRYVSEKSIFDWCGLIEKASEIHCIMSSFTSLVDRMPDINGQRLYMHSSRPPYRDHEAMGMKRRWEWVRYE